MIAMMAGRTIPTNLNAVGCKAIPIVDPDIESRYIQVLEADPRRDSHGLDLMVEALQNSL